MSKKRLEMVDAEEEEVSVEPLDADAFEDDDQDSQTFEVKGKLCEVRFNRKRIDLYEERHTPIVASFYKNDGTFTFRELSALCAYGLKVVDGPYFKPDKGQEVADRLIETNGYPVVYQAVMLALQRDCGFLFVGAGR